QDKSLEFVGPLASSMDITSRLTISDHGVEVGAKFAFFEADEKTHDFIRARPQKPYEPVSADADARYLDTIEVNCDEIGFQVAKPFRFDNVVPVGETAGVRIDQARIGSCAHGRVEDIQMSARTTTGP